MNRLPLITLAAALAFGAAASAQTTATDPQRPRPKAGTIIERPNSGGIITNTPAPTASATSSSSGDLTGRPVERFEAVGNTTVASDTIRVYLGVTPGDPYDPAALQRNFLNLWQTGLFDDIRLEADRGDNGVIVRAVVKERPRIGSVEYRGNKELQTNKITEQLEKDKIDLHVGNTIEQTLVNRAAESIRKAYTEGGFEGVSVTTSTEEMNEPGEKKIVFQINEGIKAKVASIVFTGNKHFSSSRLRGVMKEVKTNNPITWIRKKNLYIPSKLDEDLENIKNFYQDHGYQNVSFGDPQISTIGTAKKPRVKIVIPIKEGVIHRFGEVSVTGNTVFTTEQMVGNWPLKKGDVIRRKPIQSRIDNFSDAYRGHGYIYSYINPEYVVRDNNVVDVKLQVYEGEQFRLGRLEFQGNTTTKDKVLRREIFLDEGMIMDMETFKQSIYKLGQLGYFKVTENPDFKVNQEKKTVDITIKGNEEGKNDVQFGGGYSEGGGFFVQSQFSTRNFLGEGENLGLSFQKGNRQNYFSLSYSDPWFFDTPNSLGISLFDRNTRYPASVGIEDRSKGGTVAYGYRLRRFDSLSLVYGLQRSKQHVEYNAPADANGNIPIADITDFTFTTSALIPSYQYDSRDNPFDTTRGARFTLGAAFSGGPLGGTIHELKPTLGATKFFRLSRRTSISANFDGGYIVPLDKNCANSYAEQQERGQRLCVPETERFFVGGEYSVRGFRYGDLGPRELIGGITSRNAGGYKYSVFNVEHITKLNDPLRLVFFGDAGWSWAHSEKVDLSQLRYSVGAELRIFLPVFQFPLRFIYAVNPSPRKGDQFEGFQFTIGNTY